MLQIAFCQLVSGELGDVVDLTERQVRMQFGPASRTSGQRCIATRSRFVLKDCFSVPEQTLGAADDVSLE